MDWREKLRHMNLTPEQWQMAERQMAAGEGPYWEFTRWGDTPGRFQQFIDVDFSVKEDRVLKELPA